jgi:hypothetical protein
LPGAPIHYQPSSAKDELLEGKRHWRTATAARLR